MRNGRCERHGGASTGPKSAAVRAELGRQMAEAHAQSAVEEGKERPDRALAMLVAVFLERTTWQQAMSATGLSRRTLERLERRAFCSPDELGAIKRFLKVQPVTSAGRTPDATGDESQQ